MPLVILCLHVAFDSVEGESLAMASTELFVGFIASLVPEGKGRVNTILFHLVHLHLFEFDPSF